jgi:hypothetical protein
MDADEFSFNLGMQKRHHGGTEDTEIGIFLKNSELSDLSVSAVNS